MSRPSVNRPVSCLRGARPAGIRNAGRVGRRGALFGYFFSKQKVTIFNRKNFDRYWPMSEEIINKVASSGLVEINLEDYYPEGERAQIDIASKLFGGLILKEKDFRDYVKNEDWSVYSGKLVAVFCSADAIVPTWAFMLLATALQPYAKRVVFGTPDVLETVLYNEALKKINPEEFRGARVVIKGCSKLPVPVSAYVELTAMLRPFAKSIMYGEPCSTVPLFKRK